MKILQRSLTEEGRFEYALKLAHLRNDQKEYASWHIPSEMGRGWSQVPAWSWNRKGNRSCAAGSFCERCCWLRSRHCRMELWKWPQDQRGKKSYKKLWSEEVGDEVQRYSLEKHKQIDPYQRQHKGQKAKGKIKVETLTTYSFPVHNSQHHRRAFKLCWSGVES